MTAKNAPIETWTHVFEAAVNGSGSAGPIALGTGTSGAKAMADAAVRMGMRFPSGVPAEMKPLYQSLADGTAGVVNIVAGAYPLPGQMGHDYVSNETHVVAATVVSDKDARAVIEQCRHDPVQAQLVFQRPIWRKKFQGVNLALVDWSEVVADCPAEGMRETPVTSPLISAVAPVGPTQLVLINALSGRKIDADVLNVLRQCTVNGHNVHLPPVQLDRKLYARVNEVLLALGGKWVGRKVQAHVFEDDPAAVLDVAVGTGTFVKPQDFGYFPTPAAVVERLMRIAQLEPGMKVLEPEAGTGAIAIPAAQIVGFDLVTPVELLPANARKLREAGFSFVNQCDFLTLDPAPIFSRVLMNPPFSGMADVAHVMHATQFLRPDGELVAIMSPSWATNGANKAAAFRDFVAECDGEVEDVERGAFRESGTEIATKIVTLKAENFPWNRRQHERQRA
jgi:hypothetical protein